MCLCGWILCPCASTIVIKKKKVCPRYPLPYWSGLQNEIYGAQPELHPGSMPSQKQLRSSSLKYPQSHGNEK